MEVLGRIRQKGIYFSIFNEVVFMKCCIIILFSILCLISCNANKNKRFDSIDNKSIVDIDYTCYLEKLGLGEKLDSLINCSYVHTSYSLRGQVHSVLCLKKLEEFWFEPFWKESCLSEKKQICIRTKYPKLEPDSNGRILGVDIGPIIYPGFIISKTSHLGYNLKPYCMDAKCPEN
jgi:hypothetical protein